MSTTRTTPAEQFRTFQAQHGPLDSPLADAILGKFIEKAFDSYFETLYGHQNKYSLDEYVRSYVKQHAAGLLGVLELAADWSKDPLQASERMLRDDLAKLAQDEEDERKRQDDAARAVAVKKVSDDFLAQLQAGAPAPTQDPATPTAKGGK